MGYNCEIVYRPGRENIAADALSQRSDNPTLFYVFVPQVIKWEEIKNAPNNDEYMKKINSVVQTQPSGPYTLREGLITK